MNHVVIPFNDVEPVFFFYIYNIFFCIIINRKYDRINKNIRNLYVKVKYNVN